MAGIFGVKFGGERYCKAVSGSDRRYNIDFERRRDVACHGERHRNVCSALKRSGRFDRILHSDKPNKRDRLETIRFYEKNKNFDPKIDFETTAKMTSGFSGADIECIMNEAGLKATLEGRDAILQKDIDFAIDRIIFQVCKQEIAGEEKAREAVATHETGHLMAALLLDPAAVMGVSILPQGESEGHAKVGFDCNGLKTVDSVLNQAVIALAGQAAEQVFYPEKKLVGSSSDIAKAYKIVRRLLTKECCKGYEYYLKEADGPFSSESVAERRLEKIESECVHLMDECKAKAVKLIEENCGIAEKFVRKLVKNYMLTREEIFKLYRAETAKAYKRKRQA